MQLLWNEVSSRFWQMNVVLMKGDFMYYGHKTNSSIPIIIFMALVVWSFTVWCESLFPLLQLPLSSMRYVWQSTSKTTHRYASSLSITSTAERDLLPNVFQRYPTPRGGDIKWDQLLGATDLKIHKGSTGVGYFLAINPQLRGNAQKAMLKQFNLLKQFGSISK